MTNPTKSPKTRSVQRTTCAFHHRHLSLPIALTSVKKRSIAILPVFLPLILSAALAVAALHNKTLPKCTKVEILRIDGTVLENEDGLPHFKREPNARTFEVRYFKEFDRKYEFGFSARQH